MYNKRKNQILLGILLVLMTGLSVKLISMENKITSYKSNALTSKVLETQHSDINRYGYVDILECLRSDSNLKIQCINIVENQKCNVEVNYRGDIKLLYNDLHSLSQSKNFLGVNSININNDSKITNISIDFKKNK